MREKVKRVFRRFQFLVMRLFRKSRTLEYEIVFGRSQYALIENVQHLIDDGWNPKGGVSHTVTKTGGNQYDYKTIECWAQAMTRSA